MEKEKKEEDTILAASIASYLLTSNLLLRKIQLAELTGANL